MSVGDRSIYRNTFVRFTLITVILIASGISVYAQSDILDQEISIRLVEARRQVILKSITRQTGYVFTYDTELIKPGEIVSLSTSKFTVREVLDHIFEGKNFAYSVIENHIIIYKSVDESTPLIREEGKIPVYLITGTVVDESGTKALPYATIGIYEKGIGSISNYDGNFSLKVTQNSINDTLRISYLGFRDRTIPVSQAINNHLQIELTSEYVSIPEVIIRTRDPIDLLQGVLKNKRINYGSDPVLFRAFYRESVSKKDKIQVYSEAIINIYKSSYTGTLKSDQINVFKSRKIEKLDYTDTLILKLQAGLDACLSLDGIKTSYDFLDPNNFQDYDYRMTDIVNFGDEAAYVIEFTQKEEISDLALFSGSLYINTDNYALHSVEFEINPLYIEELSSSFIRESSKGYTVKVRSAKYRVDYREVNNRFYLNHVKGDLKFFTRKRRKLFGSNFNIMFEMAVTDIDSVNVERFKKDEVAPRHTIFSETIRGYDKDFWGTDNYVQPELNIQEALKELNIRLEEFKQQD